MGSPPRSVLRPDCCRAAIAVPRSCACCTRCYPRQDRGAPHAGSVWGLFGGIVRSTRATTPSNSFPAPNGPRALLTSHVGPRRLAVAPLHRPGPPAEPPALLEGEMCASRAETHPPLLAPGSRAVGGPACKPGLSWHQVPIDGTQTHHRTDPRCPQRPWRPARIAHPTAQTLAHPGRLCSCRVALSAGSPPIWLPHRFVLGGETVGIPARRAADASVELPV